MKGWEVWKFGMLGAVAIAVAAILAVAVKATADVAATFFGAFTAAIIAAVAGAAGWAYQARTEVEREARARRAVNADKVTFVYAYLRTMRTHLLREAAGLTGVVFTTAQSAPMPTDRTVAFAKTLRGSIKRVSLLPYETLLDKCLVFEPELTVEIVHAVDLVSSAEPVWLFNTMPDEMTIPRSGIEGAISTLQARIAVLSNVIAKIPMNVEH